MSSLRQYTAGPAWAAIALVLASCGGGPGDDATADAAPAENPRQTALGGVVGPLQAVPTIAEQPRAAAVGPGAGVSFSVVAQAGARNVITGYLWKKDGLPVAQGPSLSIYSIAAVAAQHLGSYTVEVTSLNGNVTSAPAMLTLATAWAQLGGRTISSDAAPQQPALSLCGDRPRLAWVQTNAVGNGELRVSMYFGTRWVAMGGVLNASPTADATEPSIDCSTVGGTPQPVVAWSEGSGNQRAIQVRAWNGSAWVAVGTNPVAPPLGNAHKPVLRLAPSGPPMVATASIHVRSAIAWLENGSPVARQWSGSDWLGYVNGSPAGSSIAELALALDRSQRQGGLPTYPPLVAHVHKLSAGRSVVSAQANVAGWSSLGQAASAISPSTSPLKIAGIGYGAERNGDGAVVVWAAGSSSYTIGSSRLAGPDYTQALLNPLGPVPAWAVYANPVSGSDLNALSFDSSSVPVACVADPTTRLSYALALNDRRGTTVMTARCNGTGLGTLDWAAVAAAHRRQAVSLSLKLEPTAQRTPLFAAVEAVGGRYELSVWRNYP